MKIHLTGIVTATAILLSGNAAWAVCTVGRITGNTWQLTGYYSETSTIGPFNSTAYFSVAFWCPSLVISAGTTPNTYSIGGACKKQGDANTTSDYIIRSGQNAVTVEPGTCNVTGHFSLKFQATTLKATIRNAKFSNPQRTDYSGAAQFSVGVVDPANEINESETLTFTLMR